jgi:cytochrome bd-type quinol oxidase subunit 2
MNTLTEAIDTGRARLVAGLTFLVAVGLPVAGILTADAREAEVSPGAGDWVFVALVAVVTAATFALLVPWSLRGEDGQNRRVKSGLTLSISAFLLSIVLFWTMLPVVFGSAGAWLGYLTREDANAGQRQTRMATAAIVIGGIATLASIVGYVATS